MPDNDNPIWLRKRRASIAAEMNGIAKTAEKEDRGLTEAEIASLNKMRAEVVSLGEQADLIEAIPPTDNQIHDQLTKAKAQPNVAGAVQHGIKKDGVLSFGEFAMGTRDAGRSTDSDLRKRVHAAATTYGSEGVGVDGGYLVPVDERSNLVKMVEGESGILPLLDNIPTQSDTFKVPVDETTPWGSSGQVLAYWESEAASYTASQMKFKQRGVSIDKLTALVPVTDELMADASSIVAYLRGKVAEVMAYKINRVVLAGLGVGEPFGIFNSGSLISTTKTASQDADSFVGMNAVNALSRLYDGDRNKNLRWLANQNCEAEILTCNVPGQDITGTEDASGGRFLHSLPGSSGSEGTGSGAILGIPIIYTQAAEVLGDVGDVYLAALKRYLMVVRTPAPEEAMSIHLYFDQSITAFRFVWRLGGMPWRNSKVTGRDGSSTYSAFVTTAARA